jgi:hypothetical protein
MTAAIHRLYGPTRLPVLVSACIVLSLTLGALSVRYPLEILGLAFFIAIIVLAFAYPVAIFIAGIALMAFPYTWTPSADGHFITSSTIGGAALFISGLANKRWFRFNTVDWVVVAYVFTSVIALIANPSDGAEFLQPSFEEILLPYIGWRMLLANNVSARKLVIPCLVAVGGVTALMGILEFFHGTGLFIHGPVDPRLSSWAHTYLRSGHVRIASSFGQPIAFGMFLLIPLALALTGTGRMRLIALALLLSAQVFTLSRGPWLATVVLFLLLLPLLAGRMNTSFIGVIILLLISTAVFAKPIAGVLSASTEQGNSVNSNGIYRANLLQTSFSQASLLGKPFDVNSPSALYGQVGFKDVASWYALTIGERGWIGIACLLALFGAAATALLRGYRYRSRMLITMAAIVISQMVALITAPTITNYRSFFWLSIACLSTWYLNGSAEPNGVRTISETDAAEESLRGQSPHGYQPA